MQRIIGLVLGALVTYLLLLALVGPPATRPGTTPSRSSPARSSP